MRNKRISSLLQKVDTEERTAESATVFFCPTESPVIRFLAGTGELLLETGGAVTIFEVILNAPATNFPLLVAGHVFEQSSLLAFVGDIVRFNPRWVLAKIGADSFAKLNSILHAR